jgi:hypothetical protein
MTGEEQEEKEEIPLGEVLGGWSGSTGGEGVSAETELREGCSLAGARGTECDRGLCGTAERIIGEEGGEASTFGEAGREERSEDGGGEDAKDGEVEM